MSEIALNGIEKRIMKLPFDEQERLLRRVTDRLRVRSDDRTEFKNQLKEMALNEDIQREIREIERDFILTEFDGLTE